MSQGLSLLADLGIAAGSFTGIAAATAAVIWARSIPAAPLLHAHASLTDLQRSLPDPVTPTSVSAAEVTWEARAAFDRAASELGDQQLIRTARAITQALNDHHWRSAHLAAQQGLRRLSRIDHRRRRR